MSRTTRLIGSLIVATMSLGVISAAASAQPASTAIAPNQAFFGLVNGKHPKATITVACPGPVLPPPATQTGHPLSGQTLGVMAASSTATSTGRTGTRGKSITVGFVIPVDAPALPVTFTHYGTQALPTSLLLPCSGTLPVVFSPQPTSKTARSVSVMVTYENIAVTPTPAATRSTTGRTITLTQADSGRSITLHRGDRLDVELSGPSLYAWTEPTSSKSAVLLRRSGSSGTEASGLFQAVRTGKTTVSAFDNPKCYPMCLPPSLLFDVSVSISG
jgi:hypothetical protein